MSKLRINAEFKNKNHKHDFNLSLIEFKEDDITIVYSPALDLSGYGKNTEEAKQSFEIALEEFVKYTTNKGTLNEVLESLGWNIKKGSKKAKLTQPSYSDLVSKNETLNNIINLKDHIKYTQPFEFA
jgi:hypothetical protein